MDQTILKSHVEKPEKLKGSDFCRWQQKMLFYLTSLHVSYVLTDSEPVDPYMVDGHNVPTEAQMADYEKNHWKRNTELKLHVLRNLLFEGMGINCNFLVGSIIEKLSQSWKNFKLYFKHLTDDMSFEQLVLKIRVEEDNRMNEKAEQIQLNKMQTWLEKALLNPSRTTKNKGKNGGSGQKYSKDGKKDYTKQKNNNFKKVYHCWVCGKPCHKAKDCCHKKEYGGGNSGGNSNQANHNQCSWGNETASKIEGKGKVILKLTSGKDLVLSNVLHVPNITKNMISGPILSNKGFKLVFESNKFMITKGGMYDGKGYLDEGLFKLSVETDDNVINSINAGNSIASVYMIDPSFLWHSRLGHVNFYSLQKLINLGMFPTCSKDKISKCEICVESKFTSRSHKSVEKSSEILGLIHTDLLNTKDGALNMFKTYKAEVKNQLDKKIKIIRFLVYKSNIDDIRNNIIIESAEADFFENIFPYKDKEKQILNPWKRVMNDQLSQDETYNNSEVSQENVEPRRSKRVKVTKDFRPDYMTYIVNEEPQTYKAAMESSESPYWKEAIQSEIDSIVQNNTWKLVDLPFGHKPVGHKWIFKKKLRLDGTIEMYKARLVAKGYRQKEGQYFFDTYSPVTRITSIRTLIAIAAIHNMIIHQMDVKTAFLNSELDEEIYMKQPEGFVVKVQEHKFIALDKATEEAEWLRSFLEAQHTTWHHEYQRDPRVLLHPSDGEAWKHFDLTHPSFAAEPRNVRLGLCDDGWSTHGKLSCPYCLEKSKAFTLKHGKKTSFYNCHCQFLPRDHSFRRNKDGFIKGRVERDEPPPRLSGEEIWSRVLQYPKDLPYWHTNLIRHNLDVMHMEKNIFDNIFNIIMDDNNNTKDNGKSRQDVKEYCKRRELELVSDVDGKVSKPKASFSLTKEQKQEAGVGGPVQYRWMYPFERYLYHLKKKVKNKSRVESSIYEAYIMEEILNFCSHYFEPHVLTNSTRVRRNDDGGNVNVREDVLSIFKHPVRPSGNSKHRYFNDDEYETTIFYVLQNCEEIQPFLRIFEGKVKLEMPNITNNQLVDFTKKRVGRWLRDQSSSQKTINTDLCLIGKEKEYYGLLMDIIEVDYIGCSKLNTLVLFKCDWFDPVKNQGWKVHNEFGLVDINQKKKLLQYNPFIMAHQAHQMYFIDYPSVRRDKIDWYAVCRTKARSTIVSPAQSIDPAYQEDGSTLPFIVTKHDEVEHLANNESDMQEVEIEQLTYLREEEEEEKIEEQEEIKEEDKEEESEDNNGADAYTDDDDF
uniref:DNA-directed RNA polymerase subunit beta n=1 Tax=Tanacetum cinerariifolium TaxID=118510 RepID=A0A6L2KID8_TANCI|nr:DNA-directed RNA polymerase subunit beta' [Tanacetum cinerariifolium]